MMRSFVLALTIFALPAQAQQGVQPSGSFTPGHTVQVLNPSGTAIGDAGGAAGSALPGQDYLTELGITNTGAPLCINDALTNNPAGYHQLCLGANAFGGGVLSYNAVGGATELPLQLIVNGVTTTLPQSGSCIGCGTMAAQNADAVAITGGSITGVTITGHASLDLASANNLSDVANAATSRTNLAIAPHVATLAALQSSTTATYPSGVWRDDYSAGLGAPPLWFLPESGTCVANSRANNGGSCVNSSGGNSWYAVFPTSGVDVREFGAVGDWNGSAGTDNAAAVQAALRYALVVGGKLVVGPGSYKLASQVTGTFAADLLHVTIEGWGRDVSYLVWTAASGGIAISYDGQFDSVDVRNLTFATNQIGGGAALTLTQTTGSPTALSPLNEIKNVGFRGSDGYSVSDYWTTSIQTNGINNVNFIGNTFTGTGAAGHGVGVDLEGTVSLNGAAYNFYGNQFTCQATGIKYGTYIQGLTVGTGNNFTCGTNGILVPPGGVATDQLTVIGSQFEVVYGIRDQTGVNGTMIANNLFITDAANSFGVSLEANATRSITGNECQVGSGTSTCISLGAGAGVIGYNNIISQNVGILLGASSQSVHVTNDNVYISTSTSITDSGTANVIDGDFAWSPVLKGSSVAGTPTYGAQIGIYHQDGHRISASFELAVSALGSMAGNLLITGFPGSANDAARGNCSLGLHVGITGNPQAAAFIESSANPIVAQLVDPTTGGNLNSYTAPVTLVGQCDYTLP
jgi:hypothetical protein